MEVFSTLPRAALPWTANILTLATLACATWWSAGQRPVAPTAPMFATSTNVASAGLNASSKDQAASRLVLVNDASANAAALAHYKHSLAAGADIADIAGRATGALPSAAVQPVVFLPNAAR